MSKKGPWLTEETRAGYGFILPNFLGFVAFILFPTLFSLYISFFDWGLLGAPTFAGLGNYRTLFQDDFFYRVLFNTVYFVLGTVPLQTALALFLAILMNQKIRGIVVFRTAMFLPVISSLVSVAFIWSWILEPDFGLLNSFLEMIGLLEPIDNFLARVGLPPLRWLASPTWAMSGVIMMSIWKNVGYHMVIFLAGLQGIPTSLYEAAEIDGASRWQKFRSITLPLLRPTTFFVVVTSVIGSFQVFDQAFIMTQGGPAGATTTIVYQIYISAFEHFKMGYAASIAWVLFAIIFVLTLIQWRRASWDGY